MHRASVRQLLFGLLRQGLLLRVPDMSQKNARAKRSSAARRTALGGIVSALVLVVMYLGSVIDVLDLSAAAFASILLIAVIAEHGRRDAICVFAVTALLSLLLLPNRAPALLYTLFLGYYPMLKITLDRLGRLRGTVLKLLVLNAALTLSFLAAHYLFSAGADERALLWLYYPLANLSFLLYDVALDRIVRLWMVKLRYVFRLDRKK